MRISKYSLNNGKDAQNAKYLYRKLKDVIIWYADVNTNFVSYAWLTGNRAIINAYKAYKTGYSLAKLSKCQKELHS